ncbi:MAG: transaldolase [Candidatus Symbiodolus clandestinus]
MHDNLTTLRRYTTVVADTGDLEAIKRYQPVDATTNPALILKVAQQAEYRHLLQKSLAWSRQQTIDPQQQLREAADYLVIQIALLITPMIPGLLSIEIPARLSYDTPASIAKAQRLVAGYRQAGGEPKRLLIKLAATWQGIQAAAYLEKQGIACNLTLLFSLAQARACAQAGVTLISPFVGRVSDWYQSRGIKLPEDPGVAFVTQIYHYYKQHGYPTIIMGASFRTIQQIIALTGCDKLTIAPALLQALAESSLSLSAQLHYDGDIIQPPASLTEAEFYWLHNQDAMAVDKLAEGIRQFATAQEQLEQLIALHQ